MRAALLVVLALALAAFRAFVASIPAEETPGGLRSPEAAADVQSGASARPMVPTGMGGRRDAARAVARLLRVQVSTRDGPSRDAEAVPRTAVVVGVGWRAGGPRGTSAVPGDFADVDDALDRTALAAVRTDGAGRAVVTLEVPASLAEADRVWAEVVEPGRQRRVGANDLDDAASESSLGLVVRDGWTLRGRVVDEAGTLVPGTRVGVRPDAGGGAPTFGTSTAAHSGRFELHDSGPGALLHLFARREQVGAGETRDVRVDPDRAPPFVEVVLRGSGRITGVLVDPAGRPLEGQPLWALPFERRDLSVAYLSANERGAAERAGGLIETRATTDAAGAFELRGLQVGEYAVRARAGGSGDYELLLTERPVRTGSEPLRLVAPLHVLRVRATDEGGAPIALWPEFGAQQSWGTATDGVFLYVHEANETGTVTAPERPAAGLRARREDGGVDVSVAAGARYLVGALSAGRSLVEREVFVGPTDGLVEVELPLGAARLPGRLVVEVEDPTGGAFASRHTSVEVFAPASGTLLAATPRAHFAPRFEVPLPEGRYRVVAGAPSLRGQHGARGPEKYLPVERWIDVRAGETVRWAAQVRAAGRLRVTVRLEGAAGARGFAEISARPAAGGPERRPLFPVEPGIVILPPSEEPRVPIGRAIEQIDALEPGGWIVRAERAGFVPREVAVTVRSGEVTPVEVTLARE